jgi:RNA polymerase sigma factor (sigma-70 family)
MFQPLFTTKPNGRCSSNLHSSRREIKMLEMDPTVFIVDDDASIRDAVKRLIRSVGLHVELFGAATDFLRWPRADVPSCLVLDVRLPGISGLDFHRQLVAAGVLIPVIFITAHGDIPMSVRAMRAGAIDFLTKPFRDQDLLDSIHIALDQDRARLDREAQIAVLRDRLASLTPREREVVTMVVTGMPNKLIAAQIGAAENTVKVHRSRAMDKMQANSLAELVKMIERLRQPIDKAS